MGPIRPRRRLFKVRVEKLRTHGLGTESWVPDDGTDGYTRGRRVLCGSLESYPITVGRKARAAGRGHNRLGGRGGARRLRGWPMKPRVDRGAREASVRRDGGIPRSHARARRDSHFLRATCPWWRLARGHSERRYSRVNPTRQRWFGQRVL